MKTALHYASEKGHAEILGLLVEGGADVRYRTPFSDRHSDVGKDGSSFRNLCQNCCAEFTSEQQAEVEALLQTAIPAGQTSKAAQKQPEARRVSFSISQGLTAPTRSMQQPAGANTQPGVSSSRVVPQTNQYDSTSRGAGTMFDNLADPATGLVALTPVALQELVENSIEKMLESRSSSRMAELTASGRGKEIFSLECGVFWYRTPGLRARSHALRALRPLTVRDVTGLRPDVRAHAPLTSLRVALNLVGGAFELRSRVLHLWFMPGHADGAQTRREVDPLRQRLLPLVTFAAPLHIQRILNGGWRKMFPMADITKDKCSSANRSRDTKDDQQLIFRNGVATLETSSTVDVSSDLKLDATEFLGAAENLVKAIRKYLVPKGEIVADRLAIYFEQLKNNQSSSTRANSDVASVTTPSS
ncbi:hypothetical protein B0H14DRAFT_2570467 [Mycena olivaceomarginata]|nr:hypothetical protein B0H14DRAFT_2570467 [Mycena olivaceomarginata]